MSGPNGLYLMSFEACLATVLPQSLASEVEVWETVIAEAAAAEQPREI